MASGNCRLRSPTSDLDDKHLKMNLINNGLSKKNRLIWGEGCWGCRSTQGYCKKLTSEEKSWRKIWLKQCPTLTVGWNQQRQYTHKDIQIVLPTSENEVAMTRRRGQALISWLEAAKTVPRGQRPKIPQTLVMFSLPMSQMVKLGTFGEAENFSNYTPSSPFGKFSEVISEDGTCSSMYQKNYVFLMDSEFFN